MSTLRLFLRRLRARFCRHDFNLREAYASTEPFMELTMGRLVWSRRTVDGKFHCAKCGRCEIIEGAITRQFVGALDDDE